MTVRYPLGAQGHVLNIRDYGAKGDGFTDDIAAIAAANLLSKEGDTILFPPARGFYRVSAPIQVLERRRYLGTWPGHHWPYRFTTTVAFTDGSRTGGVVTLTGLSSSHDIAVGDVIQVDATDAGYDGSGFIVTARTSTTVSYAQFAGDDASSGSGTIFLSVRGGIKALSGFSGAAVFLAQERTITGRDKHCDGFVLQDLWVDMGAASGTVRGVYVEGLCRSFKIDNVVCAAAKTGAGFDLAQGSGAGTAPPRGAQMMRCVSWGSDAEGFRLNNVTDSELTDLLGVSNGGSGFYATGLAESSVIGGRMVFNVANGWHLDGSSSAGSTSMGMTTLTSIATDRNQVNGVLFEADGEQLYQFVAPRLRRDGAANGAADAGFKVNSASARVEIIHGQTSVGVEDDGSGSETPRNGIRVATGGNVDIDGGSWWGVDAGYSETGTNVVTRHGNLRQYTGNRAGKTEVLVARDLEGSGTPEANVIAPVGSTYRRRDGGTGTSLYVKEVNPTGATGWVGK